MSVGLVASAFKEADLRRLAGWQPVSHLGAAACVLCLAAGAVGTALLDNPCTCCSPSR
jgi:hypothetical protein